MEFFSPCTRRDCPLVSDQVDRLDLDVVERRDPGSLRDPKKVIQRSPLIPFRAVAHVGI